MTTPPAIRPSEPAAPDDDQRDVALHRWRVLRPHLEDGVPLAAAARTAGVPMRTAQRWLATHRAGGLAGLARHPRSDRGRRRVQPELELLIEGLALRRPAPTRAVIHRQVSEVAADHGWASPGYRTVCDIVAALDPALVCLGTEGAKRYSEVFELVHRREADAPNEIWQADDTELDLWVRTPTGEPARPWLTVILDDHSRAVAAHGVVLDAPNTMNTALVLRRAIWRKTEPGWQVCGIPEVFYTDHGSDFTSRHLEQVAAELNIRLVTSLPGRPRGRGKVERFFDMINTMCLAGLPGYAPRGTPDRAEQAQLTLPDLHEAIGRFITTTYHQRVHSETRQPPHARWIAGGFLPRMPDSLEQLDLLLLTVAKPRKIHPDGVHLFGLRYLDPTLTAYVGEQVTVRYDPRDLAEIRLFHDGAFLARAICPEMAGTTISLREILAARRRHRRDLTATLTARRATVDELMTLRAGPAPIPADPGPTPLEANRGRAAHQLKLYAQE
ncbi:Mu transposase C-terminal domain-containing protein [Pseudonocardia nigra]|uniref:Mu transposase C-terminal domain-containing protein n=1 Tax=Pseudonocardia nigra TaxID=1921578 RepID=UPI001C5F04FA|nr:Mu transposase C-terminal domain-containing protein [Pseudonocardia nigra]